MFFKDKFAEEAEVIVDNSDIGFSTHNPYKNARSIGKDIIRIRFKDINVSCTTSEALHLLIDLGRAVQESI